MLCRALQLCADHCDRSAQGPAQLRSVNPLANFDWARVVKLVSKPQQRIHEREVKTVFRAIDELLHRVRVVAPPFLPRGFPETDVFGEVRDGSDGERWWGTGLWQERVDAV